MPNKVFGVSLFLNRMKDSSDHDKRWYWSSLLCKDYPFIEFVPGVIDYYSGVIIVIIILAGAINC